MSTAALSSFPVNHTPSFIETTLTDCDNFAHGNCSGEENVLQRESSSSFDLWTDLEAYRYSCWTVMLFVVLMGIVGNILIFVMMGDKQLNSLSYAVYFKFLAVSDSLVLIINLTNKSEATFLEHRPTQVFLCVLSISVRVLVTVLSPWLVVGLTLDRCVCVCFPLSRERLCTRKKAMAICCTMLGLSFVLSLPFVVGTEVVNGECFPTEEILTYYSFIQMLVPSTLPCLFILVLNIVIIIKIQRSHTFRKTFLRSTTVPGSGTHDCSTRPLALVSVLAFVTLMPTSLSTAVAVFLKLVNKHFRCRTINNNVRSILFMIYLLNFGQNFYILIASSSNYKTIIKLRLASCKSKLTRRSQQNECITKHISPDISGSESGATGLSLVSVTCSGAEARQSGING